MPSERSINFYVSPPRRRCSLVSSVMFCLVLLFVSVSEGGRSAATPPPFEYNSYMELTDEIHNLHRHYPNLTRVYSLGKSERGRDLWVIAVSNSPLDRPIGRPSVKFIGNMHGNEPVGRALLIHFAHYVLENYLNDSLISDILNNTEIHLLPTMNPDGFESAEEGTCSGTKGRYNSRGADLNRNFPDFMRKNFVRREKETKSVIKWLKNNRFVLSANFHGGAVVASYPWDNYAGFSQVPKNTLTEDHDIFYHLAKTYADRHTHMHTGLSCGDYFEGGVTNGAAWFPLTGGMQDFNYVVAGVMEITLEVSCCKFPPRSMLRHFWEENKNAMLEFVQQAQLGIRGLVTDERSKPIPHSFVAVQGRNMEYETTDRGEYWRLLLPGNYTVRAFASGYYDETKRISVTDTKKPQWINFQLKKKNQRGEFIPVQVFSELPFEFKTISSASSEAKTISTTTPYLISNDSSTENTTNLSTDTTSVTNTSETTVSATSDKEQQNSIVISPTLASASLYAESGDGAARRFMPEGLLDMQAKVIPQMRASKQSPFLLQFSAGLAPRTKYHRRVFESLFPFAVGNM